MSRTTGSAVSADTRATLTGAETTREWTNESPAAQDGETSYFPPVTSIGLRTGSPW
jgi:hypothetical protein